MWHVLVEVDGAIPGDEVATALERHPSLHGVSVNVPAPPPGGWRKALAGLGRTKPASVLLAVEAADRREAERIATAAVEAALARLGIEARLRAGAFSD